MQRYKPLAGFVICFEHLAMGEIFKTRYLLRKRYALWGVRGFISYRIEAKRVYRIRTVNI